MQSSGKMPQGPAVAFGTFLGEQLATLQMDMCARFESLRDLATQRLEDVCRDETAENQRLLSENQVLRKRLNHHIADDNFAPAKKATALNEDDPKVPESANLKAPGSAPHILQVSEADCSMLADDHPDRRVPGSSIPGSKQAWAGMHDAAGTPATSTSLVLATAQPPTSPSMVSSLPAPKHVAIADDVSEATYVQLADRRSKRASTLHHWKCTPRHTARATAKDGLSRVVPDLSGLTEEDYNTFNEIVKHAVFADAGAMKEKLREEMLNPTYNLHDKYKQEGWAQSIARSDTFEFTTLCAIGSNALWMAIDADFNPSETLFNANPVFILGEQLFCLYFVVELAIRFYAFKRKRECLADGWFCFDFTLMALGAFETWIILTLILILDAGDEAVRIGNATVFRMLRFVRLTKMARLAHLLHALPELVVMVKGIRYAARTVFFCLVLIAIVIFVFALVFRELTRDLHVGRNHFQTVPHAMTTLLFFGTMPDVEELIRDVSAEHITLGVLFVVFICITAFTLMNMLVGVLVEVVREIASVEKDRRTISFVQRQLEQVFACPEIDIDFDGTISEDEFEKLLTHPLAIQALTSVGVDVIGLVDVQEFIFSNDGDGTLSFADFVELVLNLRGTNRATVKDIVDLRMFLAAELNDFEQRLLIELRPLTRPEKKNHVPLKR